MSNIQIKGLDGATISVEQTVYEYLAAQIGGQVLGPDDNGYDQAISIWNGMINKRPAVVIQPSGVGDVVESVILTGKLGLELSIKGGGHNIAGLSLSEGGVTLDMSLLDSVEVDSESMTVRVGPGCRLRDVDAVTQQHGLATTLGFVSETGVAGLTLGGGFGYLTRQFGWTVDDLREVEIVTAGGRILRASRSENKDLFWALRGGGGNFGVVTEFVFDLHHIGPEVTGGIIAWSADEAEGAMRLYRRATESAPRQLTIVALMRNAPTAPWLPSEKHGRPMVAFVVNHTGSAAKANQDLEIVRSFGSPWVDLIQRKSYTEQQSMLDATMPDGMHYYWKSEFLPGLSEEMLATFRAQFDGLEAPANQIAMMHLEGALNEGAEDDGAVGNRDARYVLVVQSMYDGKSGTAEANKAWVREAWQALRPFTTGGNYINFQTSDEEAARISDSYRGNLDRLRMVKRRFDPDNLFRINRNIPPA